MKILSLILILGLLLTGCSAQEAIHTELDAASDDAQVVIRGRTGDDTYQVPRVDTATHSITTIEWEHLEIHEGDSYFICDVVDLGNAANRTILIITPDTTEWAHIIFEVEMELEATIRLHEGATVVASGTQITAFNRDRNSINTATAIIYHTPTISNDGLLLHAAQLGSGKKSGGETRSLNEIILRQDTNYILRVINQTNNNNVISTRISWYEHENRQP